MNFEVFHGFCSKLEGLWKALEPFSQCHVFQSYDWLMCWQDTIGNQSMAITPWIGVILDDENLPKMIFPFGVRKQAGVRVLEFLGGAQSDYQGPLIHDEWLADTAQINAAWKSISNSLPAHDVRHFIKLPAQWCVEDNPMLDIWKSIFQDYSYSSKLPNSLDEFRLRQRKKFRADSKRQRKRLSEIGEVVFEVVTSADRCLKYKLNTMVDQKSKRCRYMSVPDIFANDTVKQFYEKATELIITDAKVHFSVLKVNDEILASHWGAVYKGRFYYLMPTITYGKLGVYSPGRLLLENLVEWSIQNEIDVFDFTIGGEDYKRDWCDSEMPLFESLHLVTPLGLPYIGYIRLRRKVRRNQKLWNVVKLIYSKLNYNNNS